MGRSRLRGPWTVLVVQALLLVSIYELVGRAVPRIGLPNRDAALIAIDAAISRGRVPVVGASALPSWCFDLFSLAYLSYFALLPAVIVAIARDPRRPGAHHAPATTLFVAFLMHYALYAVVPAVGPSRAPQVPAAARAAIANEGGATTRSVRRMIGLLEGPAPDAFPSAHSSIALLVAALARRHRLRGRRLVYLLSATIVASTVVLGYHYVVDVIAAVPLACIAWRAGVLHSHAGWPHGSTVTTMCASCGRTPIRRASSGSVSSSATSRMPRNDCSCASEAIGRSCSPD